MTEQRTDDRSGSEQRTRERILAQPAAAELSDDDGRWTLTLRREFPHPVDVVWPYLVDPQQQARWSPVVGDRVLDAPGPARVRESTEAEWTDAEVLEVDAPRLLLHRWGDALMRWTLTPTDDGCRLQLEQTFADRDITPMAAAGWHLCLAVLAADAEGDSGGRIVGERALEFGWEGLRDRYADLFAD